MLQLCSHGTLSVSCILHIFAIILIVLGHLIGSCLDEVFKEKTVYSKGVTFLHTCLSFELRWPRCKFIQI